MRQLRFMTVLAAVLLVVSGFLYAEGEKEAEGPTAAGREPEQCSLVRFLEVNWTDIESTTAATRLVLDGLGYRTTSEVVSVPIAYEGLKANEADIFLGNWMPSMASIAEPYFDEGTVDKLRANLVGAKYTLAVPSYVAEGGLTSFSDIARFKDKLEGGRIYGIEAGNDGNKLIQAMIDEDAFGLGDFRLVESSEAGMLAEVKAKGFREQWIVFLGWEPHPMNAYYDMTYLSGGDDYFGPDYGSATVYTNVRDGYTEECPNVGKLLDNLEFTLAMENEIMRRIDQGEEGSDAAMAWLQENPSVLDGWLEDVATTTGEPGLPAVRAHLAIE
jgi:glycine betaine/proline transport system substrate-binding protein